MTFFLNFLFIAIASFSSDIALGVVLLVSPMILVGSALLVFLGLTRPC